jgi:hypothetical protein
MRDRDIEENAGPLVVLDYLNNLTNEELESFVRDTSPEFYERTAAAYFQRANTPEA